MSSAGMTLGQEIEADLKTLWGDLTFVGDNVLNALKATAKTVWGALSSEAISFVQGVLANLQADLKSGTMTLPQAITAVLNAAEAAGMAEIKALGPMALQALIANLIAAL